MEKEELIQIFNTQLISIGFEKIKTKYFRKTDEFLCEVNIQKSLYGEYIYINVNFYLGKFEKPFTIVKDIWEKHSPLLVTRFTVSENNTDRIEYQKYEQIEIEDMIKRNLNLLINPPFYVGKKYLLDNLKTIYLPVFNEEEILKALNQKK